MSSLHRWDILTTLITLFFYVPSGTDELTFIEVKFKNYFFNEMTNHIEELEFVRPQQSFMHVCLRC